MGIIIALVLVVGLPMLAIRMQSTPGEYKLRIQAAGDWALTVEDRR